MRVTGRPGQFRIVDIRTGLRTYAAPSALAARRGHAFAWHPCPHPGDQRPHLLGFDVAPPAPN